MHFIQVVYRRQECCMAEVQKDLDAVRHQWNTHRIRPSVGARCPAGIPDELFFVPPAPAVDCMLRHSMQVTWGPIYKESYARLMTAQHLRRTYAELVNCERLTKNHKLNLRKIYAKLTQNLRKTYDHINAVISQS